MKNSSFIPSYVFRGSKLTIPKLIIMSKIVYFPPQSEARQGGGEGGVSVSKIENNNAP